MAAQSGHIVGYARVSSEDQNLDRQIEALGEVDRLFTEKVSGKSRKRPQLEEMLAYVRTGDLVRVKSPDRLARSTRDLLDLVAEIRAKGAELEFTDSPALNTDTPQGEFMLTILAAVAQLDRAVIRERQAEGVAIAKRKGVYQRAPKLGPEQIEHARSRIAAGVPKAMVARDLGVARHTLYAAIEGTGSYADS